MTHIEKREKSLNHPYCYISKQVTQHERPNDAQQIRKGGKTQDTTKGAERDKRNRIEQYEQQGEGNAIGSDLRCETTKPKSHYVHRDTGEENHQQVYQEYGEPG